MKFLGSLVLLLALSVSVHDSTAFSPSNTNILTASDKENVIVLKLMKEDDNNQDRREFLSNVARTAATATTTSGGILMNGGRPVRAAMVETNNNKKLALPAIGLGAWAWGDSIFWGYNPKQDEELHKVFDYAVEKASSSSSSVLFDTAELYGLGRSESLLGDFRKDHDTNVIMASKFAALPFRTKAKDVVKACEASMKRLGGQPIDLYQIHFPNAWSNEDYWDGLAQAYEKGYVKAVGVSNYGSDALRACHSFLAERNIPLTSNQIQLSLLYRHPITNGLLDTCKELNVDVLAYSPLALGFLTGKYDSLDNLPSGPRNALGKQLLADDNFTNLISIMKEIASKHDGGTVSQVALNWTRAKSTIPIPGARTLRQVQQNYGALDWTLTTEELQQLDKASSQITSFVQPDKSPFPKEDTNTGLKMFDS